MLVEKNAKIRQKFVKNMSAVGNKILLAIGDCAEMCMSRR